MVCQIALLSFLRWYSYSKVVGGLHLELVQGLTGAGDHNLITIAVRHDSSLLFSFCFCVWVGWNIRL